MSEKSLIGKEVSFLSSDLKLHGTFLQPSDKSQACALLISGSGPIDRDSNMPQQQLNIMLDIANTLAHNGVSSLRYDKRGIGASEGEYWTTSFDEETSDAIAALKELRLICPQKPIIVIGHSAGATIAMRIASTAKINGCILLAGAAQVGEKVMEWQSQRIAETLPFWQKPFLKNSVMKKQAKSRYLIQSSPDNTTSLSGAQCNVLWLKQFMAFDPVTDLKKIKTPVLAITGQKDIQVDYHDLDIMDKLIQGPFESFAPPNLTHLLREYSGKPGLKGYISQFKMPMSKNVNKKIIDWINSLS